MLDSVLKVIAWLACVVYSSIPWFWFAVHPRVDYWRSRRRSPYRVLLPYWMALWILGGALTWRWRGMVFYSTRWAWLPAGALLLAGFSIYFRASKNFSSAQLGGLPEVQPGHRDQHLVTDGIRAHVRHPVYLAHLCEMIGWSVGTGIVVGYLLTASAIVTGAIMIRMEERELENRFGDQYRAYRRSVPAILPRPNWI
jgi:protein-S-isoprenylcysteine O-methyltransferase Ste14